MAESRVDKLLRFGAENTRKLVTGAVASELLSRTPENFPLLGALVTNEVASAAHLAAMGIALGAFASWVLDPRPFDQDTGLVRSRDRSKNGNPIRVLREEVMAAIETGLEGKPKLISDKPLPFYLATSQDQYGHRNYDVSWMPDEEQAYALRLRNITPKADLRKFIFDTPVDPLKFFLHQERYAHTRGIPNEEMLHFLRTQIPLATHSSKSK